MRAFSLVELSIVLVILGLLTGGILAGQSLIRAAELRSVSTEFNRWATSVHTFRDKYFAFPGDMANATAFWGALDGNNGTGTDCQGEATSLPTCNGDANGQVLNGVSGASTAENYLFWKHLANAGLIEGNYTGNNANKSGNVLCIGTSTMLPGCNTPLSKLGTVGWAVQYVGNAAGDAHLFDGSYGNVMSLSTNSTFNTTYALTSPELWNIDTKLDDGRPASGQLVAARWNICATGAASTADIANAAWILNNNSLRCTPVFRNAF